MNTLYGWLRSMFSSLPEESDSPEASTQTADDAKGCQIFSDALDEELRQMDLQNQRIADLLDQFWNCRKSHAAESTNEFQRQNVTQQSLNGAKLLLTTAANRVRQVVEEIEIVTRQDAQ